MLKVNAGDFTTVQAAIDFLSKQDEKRELVIPAGVTETGALTLISDLTLNLEKGAVLKFIDDPNIYEPIWTRWEGVECYAMHPLLYASECENIKITGLGTIDGSGQAWWDKFSKIEQEDRVEPREDYEWRLAKLNPDYKERTGGGARPCTQFLRPPLIQFWKCKNIIFENFTLQNSPFWTLHTVYSENITIQKMTIKNPANAINTDAIDIDSCKNISIQDCLFDVGDDAITLKSGSGTDGLRVNIPTENVKVNNCKILASHGGIAIGSETAGGIKDVYVKDCKFLGTQRGVRLKSRRGRGGTIENITLENLEMDGCWCPIVLGMYFAPGILPQEEVTILSVEAQEVVPTTPHIKNIKIKNINAINVRSTAAFIVGLPESPIENVEIDNFNWSLAPDDNLLQTWNSEPTKGLFHDENRGIKTINIKNLTINKKTI